MTDKKRLAQVTAELKKLEEAHRKSVQSLRDERDALEAEERKAHAISLIGNCYVFQNGSGGQAWPLYHKVIGEKEGSLIVESFEKDTFNDAFYFRVEEEFQHSLIDERKRITREKYEEAKAKFFAEMKEVGGRP